MLNEADRALAERDPSIPGLAVVLDPDAVRALFDRDVGSAAVHGARPTYVRYKPATNCVVGYELSTAAGTVLASAKAHAPSTTGKLAKARQREVHDERSGLGVVTDDARGVLIAAAISDRQLPALRVLGDPARGDALMRSLLPARPDLWTQRPRAIRHKPERRWLAVVEDGGQPVALIKAYRAADFETARCRSKLLATPAGQPLGWSRRRAALASDWVAGTSLSDLLRANRVVDMETVGRALVALHHVAASRSVGGAGPRRSRTTLHPAAEAIARLLPRSAGRAARLADDIAGAMPTRSSFDCVIHGDFSADQVIVSDAGAHLIDFDQAQVADPTTDLASFSAELIRAELEGRLGRGRADALSADLLDAYHRAGGRPVHAHLGVHRSAALLRVAVAPFRERHPDWPEVGEALLDVAERCLTPSTSPAGGSP